MTRFSMTVPMDSGGGKDVTMLSETCYVSFSVHEVQVVIDVDLVNFFG